MNTPVVSGKWGVLIAALFTLSVLTCLKIGVSLVYGLFLTMVIAMSILSSRGIPVKQSGKWMLEGIWSIRDIYFVVLLIGINVSMWISSGIVPGMIYYGFEIVDKVNFLLFAYLMAGFVAFFLGTGLGTLSTIGVALFSLGSSIGLPPGVLVGALISGAYVADRLSPISALVNFTLETTAISFKTYFKKTAWVMLPAAVLTAIIYYFISFRFKTSISNQEIQFYKEILQGAFGISPLLFLIPVVVLWASFRGISSKVVLIGGILVSAAVTVFYQAQTLSKVISFMLFGFNGDVTNPLIESLEIGGAVGMIEVVFIIMAGISMSTLFEKCGWIQPIIEKVQQISKSKTQTVANTGLLSTVLNALTCDQTVGILVPGKYFKSLFKSKGLDDGDLAQVIANSGTALAPLMPWNVNAIIILTITGVSAITYAPFTVFNWITFPVAILLTGWMKRGD